MDAKELALRVVALEGRLAEMERARDEQRRAFEALRAENDLLRSALLAIPDGIAITDASGRARLSNAAHSEILGGGPSDGESARLPRYDVLMADGVTPASPARDPTARALKGEPVDALESALRDPTAPESLRWISTDARPLCDAAGAVHAAVTVIRDVTEHKEIVRELDAAVAANEVERQRLIARLKAAMEDLSTPIAIWDGVLVVPMVGEVARERSAAMTSRLLAEILKSGAHFVIIDWTGTEVVEPQMARRLLDLVSAVELVGARCVLTGIRAKVARSLLALDVTFDRVTTLRSVKHGLRYCLSRLGDAPARSR